MSFGIYVHIPYCIQRCHYCDFVTFEQTKILPPNQYISALKNEIQQRAASVPYHQIDTLYFGGGTPSLISAELIISVIHEIEKAGFKYNENTEITLEINPATVNEDKLAQYLNAKINRFSVGAQTFSEKHLKACGREHNASDTHKTLKLLQKYDVNYSFDLLFALPSQTPEELQYDLKQIKQHNPPHLSAYCLTVPESHPMSFHRPQDVEQVKMFENIEASLKDLGLHKYEISNFSRKGFESQHNKLYWSDQAYWGLGLSAHSYFPDSQTGVRFWNPPHIDQYLTQSQLSLKLPYELPSTQFEKLKAHELATDLCHIYLRTQKGLPKNALRLRLSENLYRQIEALMNQQITSGHITESDEYWSLTARGQLLSNQVFSELTFLPS